MRMTLRLDPYAVSPKEMQELISFQEFRDESGVESTLVELLRARVSQLNGCRQGIRRHLHNAATLGERKERLSCLAVWQEARLFTDRERAALGWTEVVTLGRDIDATDAMFVAARQWFTDCEIVKLTMLIAATIAWNRVDLSFSRDGHGSSSWDE
jgi:AhpD family alkylhydroperoxidase